MKNIRLILIASLFTIAIYSMNDETYSNEQQGRKETNDRIAQIPGITRTKDGFKVQDIEGNQYLCPSPSDVYNTADQLKKQGLFPHDAFEQLQNAKAETARQMYKHILDR